VLKYAVDVAAGLAEHVREGRADSATGPRTPLLISAHRLLRYGPDDRRAQLLSDAAEELCAAIQEGTIVASDDRLAEHVTELAESLRAASTEATRLTEVLETVDDELARTECSGVRHGVEYWQTPFGEFTSLVERWERNGRNGWWRLTVRNRHDHREIEYYGAGKAPDMDTIRDIVRVSAHQLTSR
jgi:hypothetical protein